MTCPGSVIQLGLEISADDSHIMWPFSVTSRYHPFRQRSETTHWMWKLVPQTFFRVGKMSPPLQLGAPLRGSLSSLRSWSWAYFSDLLCDLGKSLTAPGPHLPRRWSRAHADVLLSQSPVQHLSSPCPAPTPRTSGWRGCPCLPA